MNKKGGSFLGRGWVFPPSFNLERGTIEMAEDEEDIEQSLHIILGTIPGERVMFPSFGCGIRKFVFESNDPTHITMLKDVVYDAILYNEPRVKVEKIEVNNEVGSDGLLQIHIFYTVIITNTRNNIVFPFYFKEGTNL